MTLTIETKRAVATVELPARTVTLHGIDFTPDMISGAVYRNWTDGQQGVVATPWPGNAMEVKG